MRRSRHSQTTGGPPSTGSEPVGPIREEQGRVLVGLRVTPRASRDDLTFDGATLRVRVTAAPVEGAANEAVTTLLARRLRLPKSCITLLHGAGSRDKLVAIEGIAAAELRARLEG